MNTMNSPLMRKSSSTNSLGCLQVNAMPIMSPDIILNNAKTSFETTIILSTYSPIGKVATCLITEEAPNMFINQVNDHMDYVSCVMSPPSLNPNTTSENTPAETERLRRRMKKCSSYDHLS